MIWVLDAYNLMYKLGLVKNSDTQMESQDAFLKKAAALRLGKKDKIIVVFDGQKYSESSYKQSRIRVIYSSKSDKKADGVIKRLSEQYENQPMTVVSSDGEIRHYVRRGGHKVISRDDFIREYMTGNHGKQEEDRVKDLENLGNDYWLNMFKSKKDKNQDGK